MKVRDDTGASARAAMNPLRPAPRIPRPEPGTRPVRVRRHTGSRIVLALMGAERPTAQLQRAASLARTLDARVDVLCVLPGAPRLRALFSRRSVLTAARAVELALSAQRGIRAWLRDSLGSDFGHDLGNGEVIEHLSIVRGDFVEQAAAYAATIGSRLIIVPPRKGRLTGMVTSLAGAALTPVLVAHERPGKPVIVAATDLRSNDFPVLREAAEFGQRLDARLVAVHNIEPGPMHAMEMGWTINLSQPPAVHEARSEQLSLAARQLPIDTQTVVLDEFSSAGAILAEAEARAADCVVVGTRRPSSWLDEFSSSRVATQVIERAACSVLVLPLDRERPTIAGGLGLAPR